MAACETAERSATARQWLKHFTFLEETVLVFFLFFLHEFGGKSNARVTLSHRAVKTWPCKRGQEKKNDSKRHAMFVWNRWRETLTLPPPKQ